MSDRPEARMDGNTYTYVGESYEVPELQYEEARVSKRNWAWTLLLAPLLVVPFFIHHAATKAAVEDATQDYTVHVHHVHHYHSASAMHDLSAFHASATHGLSIHGAGSDIGGLSSIHSDSDMGSTMEGGIDAGSAITGDSTIDDGSDMDGAIDAGSAVGDGSIIDSGSFGGGSTIDDGSVDMHGAIDAGSAIGDGSVIDAGSAIGGVSTIDDGSDIGGSAISDGSIIDAGSAIGGSSTIRDGSDISGIGAIHTIHTVHTGPAVFHHAIRTVHLGQKEVVVKHHYLTQEKAIHVPVPIKEPDHVVVDKVFKPHTHYSCAGVSDSLGTEMMSTKHKAWCCWKMNIGCAKHVVNQDKYIHVTKTHTVPVPHYYKVPVPAEVPKPIVVKTPIPSEPLPPKKVTVPVPVPGEVPPPVVHYKYKAEPVPFKVHHVVYDKEHVPVPVTVKKYVKEYVPEKPEVIYKTHHVIVHEHAFNCDEGANHWRDMWNQDKKRYCCWKMNLACPTTHYKTHTIEKTRVKYVKVPVPSPPKIIVRHHEEHQDLQSFDCSQGFSNWWKGWSPLKKKYCCAHEHRGCPGAAHGHFHLSVHVSGGAAAGGKTYDCDAGFSNWLQGWSDSKKTWCCAQHQKGCAEHHCYTGEASTWAQDKRDWCCKNAQRGCAHTTLSPLGCDAVCTKDGKSSTCKNRIQWLQDKGPFAGVTDACNRAYSEVQVECDICRGCSAAAAGCEAITGVATSAPFDCNAALNNFARAWSPPKKQWCCNKQGKGCEGSSPPSVSAGAGMIWKHVQVNGFWTWTAVHGAGGAAGGTGTALPYDCHAGLANWKLGWSAPKKGWCCSHEKMGCPGMAGGTGAGMSGSWSTSWTSSHGHALPPSIAGHGMEWHWSGDHWMQEHMTGAAKFHCHAQMGSSSTWSPVQKHWCCIMEGIGCE